MATTYTASAASGYLTNVIFYDEGPLLVMAGHYSAPGVDTGLIETGMYAVDYYYVQDADTTTFVQTAGSNGTIGVYFSGMVSGATGCFEFKGR